MLDLVEEFHRYIAYHFCQKVTSCGVKKQQGFPIFFIIRSDLQAILQKLLGLSTYFYWKTSQL